MAKGLDKSQNEATLAAVSEQTLQKKKIDNRSVPSAPHRKVHQVRVRERPSESNVWLALGMVMISVSASTATAAMDLGGIKIRTAVLWTSSAAAAIGAILCFAAHIDVNRGRKVKRSVVEIERDDD